MRAPERLCRRGSDGVWEAEILEDFPGVLWLGAQIRASLASMYFHGFGDHTANGSTCVSDTKTYADVHFTSGRCAFMIRVTCSLCACHVSFGEPRWLELLKQQFRPSLRATSIRDSRSEHLSSQQPRRLQSPKAIPAAKQQCAL